MPIRNTEAKAQLIKRIERMDSIQVEEVCKWADVLTKMKSRNYDGDVDALVYRHLLVRQVLGAHNEDLERMRK